MSQIIRSLKAIMPLGCLLLGAGVSGVQAESWDITDTGQPNYEVEFSVTEGTWLSVDVSPDGKTLVFDLLGDIYTLPATGGEASLIRGGAALERIPSFSPDGSKILYVSDRSGEDNIWVANTDGSAARMITQETTNMLTNPEWSADGEYVVAARVGNTFDSQKMSTLQLFHINGGKGRTLVETPENKRDVQEPNFSSDGRYIYYTQRLVDHHIFVDANHVNYGIMRRDLATGETTALIKGFGGALSPQVSPNNKRLAFVRRVKDKTVLFVHDLISGEQRPVYADLDRDQQADFYLQGVYYPQFDWFPDNKHVAIWGKGKLFKINMDTGEAKEIPFLAHTKHRITKTPRFSDDLAPEQLTVKTVRQLAIAKKQSDMVFHALGYLWKKELPNGKPKRITSSQAFEFDPAFSPNNRKLAYVEWDDEKGSALTLATPSGKRKNTLVESRGVIRQPVFSPDGKYLAYIIDENSKTLGGYRAKPGLYIVSVQGGESKKIAEMAQTPIFSNDGKRVYYTRMESKNTYISSVTTEGFDHRDHVLAKGADRHELKLSPDGQWIAFKEDQQYYVLPYKETGALTEISAKDDAVPVTALTVSSGYNLAWAPDSSALYWTLGKDLYRVSSSDFSTHAANAAPYASIGLIAKGDKPAGVVAFTGGQVITMQGDKVIAQGTVVVEGNRIVAVGDANEVLIPKDAHIVDTTGKTVMPGLVDMHGHIDCCYYGGLMPQKHASHYAAAAYGITTNYDPYTSEIPAYAAMEMQQAGILVGPRFLSSGRVIYGRPGKGDTTYQPLHSYADAENVMVRKRALGGRVIKSYKQPSRRARQQLVKAGREAGVMVDAEGESHFYFDISMILDGHMALEHVIPVANYYDDIVQLMAHSDIANTPTLNVTFGEIMGENYFYQSTRAWTDPKIKSYVQDTTSSYSPVGTPYSAPLHVRSMTSLHAAEEIWDVGFRAASRSVKKLDDAGVIINAGSHGQVYGLALHWELQSMAQGGMENHKILRTATINGAKTLGVEEQIGSLQVGKLADIIVLEKNPLADIRNTNSVIYTMINGRLYDSFSMNEVGNYQRPRSKFYWELPDYNDIDWNEAWSGQ
ncbi:amidohydrolase family protein [Dasania sp. GY-MA-18]|uniref:Amidohydrolase family protein n=1 Tax=Dasania phycosphaerae TaxID=2950436 RepID=A0A9J6RJ47_9GAMM|nr:MULTISPECIES: amidohydrolase family protein [Dasania]MCR8921844.1 amidohydrolase family protein [Dasania sp. GY-MA-18]MCZ0864272.1 amidohydrolase family protein [Dasania phycosphaerae]MCZ0868000.1 amidohydrolase family protein [Dasania phycosphaerae]